MEFVKTMLNFICKREELGINETFLKLENNHGMGNIVLMPMSRLIIIP